MKQITRQRALELAMFSIENEMERHRIDAELVATRENNPDKKYPVLPASAYRRAERYAELAAALAYIENLARQKELL